MVRRRVTMNDFGKLRKQIDENINQLQSLRKDKKYADASLVIDKTEEMCAKLKQLAANSLQNGIAHRCTRDMGALKKIIDDKIPAK